MRQQNDCEIVKPQSLPKTMGQVREWMGYS
jgi:hypothetical protein